MKGDYEVFLMNKWRLWLISCFVILSLLFVRIINKDNSQDLAVYINGEHQNNIPKKGEAMFQRAVCDNDVKASWNNDSWSLIINNLSQKTKCNLYFYQGQTVFNFDYTGAEQIFTVPVSGTYRIELWGASGGNSDDNITGGLGGYVSGNINISENKILYVYVGGQGQTNGSNGKELSDNFYNEDFGTSSGGYNGGGNSGNQSIYNGSGGGATDIRLVSNSIDNFSSLKSRIIVAAGGGGSSQHIGYKGYGGSAGGLIGNNGTSEKDGDLRYSGGGTQISNGYAYYDCMVGSFGQGGSGYNKNCSSNLRVDGAGGGGYYGGSGGGDWGAGGSGGSSFISGHNGCDAIKEESTEDNIVHTGQSIHYSGLYFTDTVLIDGSGYKWTTKKGEYTGMPSYSDNSMITGNTGNGYARITLISVNE